MSPWESIIKPAPWPCSHWMRAAWSQWEMQATAHGSGAAIHFTHFIAEFWWTWALGDFYILWPSGISGNVRGWFLRQLLIVLRHIRSFINSQRACLHMPGLLCPSLCHLPLSLSMSTQRNSRCHGNLVFITTSARASVVSILERNQSYYLQSHKREASFDKKEQCMRKTEWE